MMRAIHSPPRSRNSPKPNKPKNKMVPSNSNEIKKLEPNIKSSTSRPSNSKLNKPKKSDRRPTTQIGKSQPSNNNSKPVTDHQPPRGPTTTTTTTLASLKSSNEKGGVVGSAAKPKAAVPKDDYNNSSFQNLFGSPKHEKPEDHLHVRDHLQQPSTHGKGKDVGKMVQDAKEEEGSPKSNGSRILKIKKEIASQRQGNSSIISYFSKLKELWDELELEISNENKQREDMERDKTMQFLSGLNESYSTICAQLLMMSPYPTLEQVCSAIIREEKHRELVSSLELVAEKVKENNWLHQNGQNDGVNDQHQVDDQNQVTSLPIDPLLDLGSPVQC